jgi:predicted TIM-barrel fold metal-dependent hydrolase
MTKTLEALHGRVMDVCSFDRLPFSHYADVFGAAGRRFLEANEEPFRPWTRVMGASKPDTAEITPETVWASKEMDAPSAIDLTRRPAVLDMMGIDRQLMFPALLVMLVPLATGITRFQPPPSAEGVKAAVDLLDIYNEWAGDLTKRFDRLRIAGGMTTNVTPEAMAKQADRIIAAGVKVLLIPSRIPPGGVSPGDPVLDPFYARLAEANIVLTLRGGAFAAGYRSSEVWGATPDSVWAGGTSRIKDATTVTSLHEAEETFLTAMVMGGVFERHPTLRFGLFKLGASWIGPLAERMDRGQPPFFFSDHLPMKPSEYLARNVRVTPLADAGDKGDAYEPVEVYFQRYPQIRNCYCYGSDFPLTEGGKWSLNRFYDRVAPLGDEIIEKFFVTNGQLVLP